MITIHDKTYRKRIEEIKYYKEMYDYEIERNINLLNDIKDLQTQINYYILKSNTFKTRLDKAINLIENYHYTYELSDKVIDILKGSDSNE